MPANWEPCYASRLTFSPSPYPPLEECKPGEFGPPLDEIRFWEWRSFCASKMERVEGEGENVVQTVRRWVGKVDQWAAGFI